MPTIPYQLEFGFKEDWQYWQKLIGADPVFYNNMLDNFGMSKNISLYSNEQGYTVHLRLVAEVSEGPTDTHVTEYEYVSEAGTILDNGENVGEPTYSWSAVVKIKRADGTLLPLDSDGLQTLVYNEDLTFITEFTLTSATLTTASFPNIWGIHRIQKSNGGQDIEEFSSIRSNDPNGILQPLSPATDLDVAYTSPTKITTTCIIDGTKLTPGQGYNFSARIDYTPS